MEFVERQRVRILLRWRGVAYSKPAAEEASPYLAQLADIEAHEEDLLLPAGREVSIVRPCPAIVCGQRLVCVPLRRRPCTGVTSEARSLRTDMPQTCKPANLASHMSVRVVSIEQLRTCCLDLMHIAQAIGRPINSH